MSPGLNLALVLDVSGSMYEEDGTGISRLKRIQEAAVAGIQKLKPTDLLTIVAFAHNSQVVLPPTLFLGSILGLIQGVYKLARWMQKLMLRQKSRSSDRELPFGPYLSMAALILMLAWPWLWKGPLSRFYTSCAQVARFLATGALD